AAAGRGDLARDLHADRRRALRPAGARAPARRDRPFRYARKGRLMRRKLLPLVLLLIAVGLVGVLLLRPGLDGRQTLTGYVEGEPLYLAAPVSGAVEQVFVHRGQEVAAGDPLFVVDPTQLAAQRDQ